MGATQGSEPSGYELQRNIDRISNSAEPSGYELQRSIERIEQGMTHGLTEIKIMIAGLVSRDLFDFEAKTQNERILRLEVALEKYKDAEASSRQRFWIQVVIPLLAIAAGVAIAILL